MFQKLSIVFNSRDDVKLFLKKVNLDTYANRLKLENVQASHLVALEKIFNVLSPTDLLTGQKKKANFNEIIAAIEHAKILTAAFTNILCCYSGLLKGEDRQVYFDVLVKAGSNAEKLSKAFFSLCDTDLLTGVNKQANRDAIVGAIEHAEILGNAFRECKELLKGDYRQTYFDELVKAGPNAKKLAKAFHNLSDTDLLTGEKEQANREALVKVSEHGEILANAFGWCQELLKGKDRQFYFDELVKAGPNAEKLAKAFHNLSDTDLLTGEKEQANREALVNASEYAEDLAYAFDRCQELLKGEDRQVYFDELVKAGPNAKKLANAFGWCQELLKGEDRQVYFDELVKAGPNLEKLAEAFCWCQKLLKGEDRRVYFDELIKAGPNAEKLSKAFFSLCDTDLLTGVNKQANREALVKVSEHGEILADAFDRCQELLKGEDRQVYFDELVKAGPNAEKLAKAFHNLSDTDLLTGEKEQANREALVKVSEHGEILADAFGWGRELLKGKDRQFYFDELVKAGPNAKRLENVFSLLMYTDLLTGKNKQANREVVVKVSEEHGEILAGVFGSYLYLLKGENRQAYFDAFVKAGPNAEKLAKAFHNLRGTELLTGENQQANREALIMASSHLEELIELFKVICESNQALLTQNNFNVFVKLDGKKAKETANVLKTLGQHSRSLITQENLDALLASANPQAEANRLTGKKSKVSAARLGNSMTNLLQQNASPSERVIADELDNGEKDPLLSGDEWIPLQTFRV